mgnify:CR=1 FL=1
MAETDITGPIKQTNKQPTNQPEGVACTSARSPKPTTSIKAIRLDCIVVCCMGLVDEMDDDEDEAATRRTTTRRSTIDYGNMLNITQSARHRERESLPPEYPSSHL